MNLTLIIGSLIVIVGLFFPSISIMEVDYRYFGNFQFSAILYLLFAIFSIVSAFIHKETLYFINFFLGVIIILFTIMFIVDAISLAAQIESGSKIILVGNIIIILGSVVGVIKLRREG